MMLYTTKRKPLDTAEPAAPAPVGTLASKSEAHLRQDAETILRAAVAAVEPSRLVTEALRRSAAAIPPTGTVHVAGFGIAAAAMARGARSFLGSRLADGILVVPAGEEPDAPPGFDAFGGGIPIPDPGGVAGARAIRQMVRELSDHDTLLALVSGGGSSLLTVPPDGLPLEEIQTLIRLLIEAGAPESDIERVHRHIDLVKGGRLAVEAAPARVVTLLISDVVGDAPELVAAGPLAPERSRASDAVAALKQYGVWRDVPLAVRGYLDRARCRELPDPPGAADPCFERVTTLTAGNGHTAARAACEAAERLGYESQVLTEALTGDARKAGEFLAATAVSLGQGRGAGRTPLCVVSAGTIRPAGKGPSRSGPNQELALAAAPGLASLSSVLVASMDTGGSDARGAAAGAIATGSTARRAAETGQGCLEALETGEAGRFFEALDDLILSGPTGTGVGDIQLLLLC